MRHFTFRQIRFGLAIAGITVCICCRIPRTSNVLSSDDTEAVAESVFHYQIEHVQLRDLPQLYFLSLGEDQNPPSEFLARFGNFKFPVKGYSDSVYHDGRVTEKSTKQRGIRLEVKRIKQKSNFEVDAEASWFVGHEDYQEQVFSMYREDGKWLVKEVRGILDP